MYDTPSELHHRLFAANKVENGLQGPRPQTQPAQNARVKTLRDNTPVWNSQSPYHPYIVNSSESHLPYLNKSQPNLKASSSSAASKVKLRVRAKSSEKLPRSRKSSGNTRGTSSAEVVAEKRRRDFIIPQQKNNSQGSLGSNRSNPEVDRILAQPTILQGGLGPSRTRASTMNSAAARDARRPSASIPVDIEDEEEAGEYAHAGEITDISTGTFEAIEREAVSGTAFFGDHPSPPPALQVTIQDHSVTSTAAHLTRSTEGYPTPHSEHPCSPNLLAPPSPAFSVSSSVSRYSSDALSIPAFYNNPRASPRLDDSSDSNSRRSMDTLRSLDTMAGALRALGPVCTPTIEQMPKRPSKRDRKRRRESTVDIASSHPKGIAVLTATDRNIPAARNGVKGEVKGKGRITGAVDAHAQARAEAEARARAIVTPSPLVMSPNPVGLPPLASRRSSAIVTPAPAPAATPRVVGGNVTRTIAPGRPKLMVVNADPTDDDSTPTITDAAQPASKAVAKVHKIPRIPPPPLSLAPTLTTVRQRKIHRRQSRASSIVPPLSPALSTVSTIAAIISGRPRKPSDKELRRRRFNKLTRTLGEDIPPELLVSNLAGNGGGRGHSLVVEGTNARPVGVGARDSKISIGGIPASRMVWNRHSIAGDELISPNPNPRLSTHWEIGSPDSKFSTGSPNVLKKFPSIRRKDPNALAVSTSAKLQMQPPKYPDDLGTPLASPVTPDSAAPYFENHPFRVVIEDTDAGAPYPSSSMGGTFGPLTENGHPQRYSHAQRDSIYSVRDDIPWMRASLALPIAFETPFIEYAGIAGIMRDVGERGVSPGLLDVRNARAEGGLDPSGVYRREKRQGWSGEWNQPNIQDVIQKLRQL